MAIDTKYFSDQYQIDAMTAIYNHSLNNLSGDPGIAPGSDDTTFQIATAFTYKIGGITYTKAAADDIAAPGASTSSGEFRKILLSIDSAGTVTATAGTVSEVSQAAAQLPDVPADEIGIGYLELPASFTSATTSLTAGMCKPFAETIDLTPNG